MNKTKPFKINRQWVLLAYLSVASNKGGCGVDRVSLDAFAKNEKNYLYELWNQMGSGSYMLPAVRLMEIPKKDGGVRSLGIPTVSDRIGQTVVKGLLEGVLEPLFDEDSYGYRPGKSAKDAIRQARKRRWMLLYMERWLVAPLQKENGEIVAQTKGVPQGSVVGPLLANLYLHYCMDEWLRRKYPECRFERYADDAIIHCKSKAKAVEVRAKLEKRMEACGLQLHPVKTKTVYCKDSNRRGTYENISFDFLGYTIKPRLAKNSIRGVWFTNWLPAVSHKSLKATNEKMKGWQMLRSSGCKLEEVVAAINPVIQGWISYYGQFYKTKLINFMQLINVKLARWARRKYKGLRTSDMKVIRWLHGTYQQDPYLFAHWKIGSRSTV